MFYDFFAGLEDSLGEFKEEIREGVDTVALPMMDLERKRQTSLTIDLNGNVYINGVIRYGKSVFTKQLVRKLEAKANPDTKVVFFDVKNDTDNYLHEFYQTGDKVICYSDALEKQGYDCFKFNLIRELRQAEDPETELKEIVEILLEDSMSESGDGKFFWQAAGQIFQGFVNTVLHAYGDCPSNRIIIQDMKGVSIEQLKTHLLKWPGNANIVRDYLGGGEKGEMSRMTQSIMACFSELLDVFRGNFCIDGEDTITDFLAGKYGGRLFLEYDYASKASSNKFFRYFLHKIIQSKLSREADSLQKIVMVLDEVSVLDAPFSLTDGLLVGASQGLQIILCSQSIERLYGISHVKNIEHSTNAILSGFSTIVTFHTGDPESERKLQEIFGERYIERVQLPLSRRDFAKQEVLREKWLTSEKLAKMGVGEFFAKRKEKDPVHGRLIL